jgi:hypothetical protein
MTLEVATMLRLGLVKSIEPTDLRDDRRGVLRTQSLDVGPHSVEHAIGLGEYYRAVLGPHVSSLAIGRGRIVRPEKYREQIFELDSIGIVVYPHDFGMAGATGADRLVIRRRIVSAGIAGHRVQHARHPREYSFDTPEASTAQHDDFGRGHKSRMRIRPPILRSRYWPEI